MELNPELRSFINKLADRGYFQSFSPDSQEYKVLDVDVDLDLGLAATRDRQVYESQEQPECGAPSGFSQRERILQRRGKQVLPQWQF